MSVPTCIASQQVKSNISNASLASSHRASTAMEKEVEMLLNAGGTSEKGLMEKEAKELEAKVSMSVLSYLPRTSFQIWI